MIYNSFSLTRYKKYVLLDPLGVVTKTRSAIEEEVNAMAEAPSTIVHNEEMFRATAENFLYMPKLGTVPEIAVPELLPNLPGRFTLFLYFEISSTKK